MDKYTIGWLAWGALFALIEGHAIATKNWNGTLSNHVRRWIGSTSPTQNTSTYVRRGMLVIFMGWLTGHFVMDWWG